MSDTVEYAHMLFKSTNPLYDSFLEGSAHRNKERITQ
jgi:hypothetical protein